MKFYRVLNSGYVDSTSGSSELQAAVKGGGKFILTAVDGPVKFAMRGPRFDSDAEGGVIPRDGQFGIELRGGKDQLHLDVLTSCYCNWIQVKEAE